MGTDSNPEDSRAPATAESRDHRKGQPGEEGMDSSSEKERGESERAGESNGDTPTEKGVEVVERPGMYVYQYPETLHLEDPYKNYLSKRRINDGELQNQIKALLQEEEGYEPKYTARCLPVYDYGVVLVEDGSRETYLFSFRCNTMHYMEKKLWKDFSPIRARLYTLLAYQINDNTSVLIDGSADVQE